MYVDTTVLQFVKHHARAPACYNSLSTSLHTTRIAHMPDLPSGTVTFLFTSINIVGSTTRWDSGPLAPPSQFDVASNAACYHRFQLRMDLVAGTEVRPLCTDACSDATIIGRSIATVILSSSASADGEATRRNGQRSTPCRRWCASAAIVRGRGTRPLPCYVNHIEWRGARENYREVPPSC